MNKRQQSSFSAEAAAQPAGVGSSVSRVGASSGIRPLGFLDRYFYFCMSLLIAGVVIYGFSHTVSTRLFHTTIPRPSVLYVHAAVFSAWILFFIFQSVLIRTHNLRVHRLTGWFGAVLGIFVPVLGVLVAVAMIRFDLLQLHSGFPPVAIFLPFNDMFCFTVPFVLAIYWRKRSDFHRRLLLLATCAITSAAFTRFPENKLPFVISYVCVDLMVALGVVRDLLIERRVHRVYLIGLPCFILCQTVVVFLVLTGNPYLVRWANTLLN